MRKILCTLAMMGMFAFAASAQSNSGNYPQSSNSPTTTQNDQSANPNNPQQATPANPDQNTQATPSNPNSSATSSQTADQQEDQNEAMNKKGHEKSLRGCIESQNGEFVLQEKNGKVAKLSSTEDLSAHVGHEVKLRGMWVTGSAASTSNMGNTTASAEPNKYPSTDSSNTTTTNSSNQSAAPAGTSTETQIGQSTTAQNNSNLPQSDVNANGNMKWDHPDQTFQVSNIKMKSDHCTMKVKGSSTQTGVGNNPPSM